MKTETPKITLVRKADLRALPDYTGGPEHKSIYHISVSWDGMEEGDVVCFSGDDMDSLTESELRRMLAVRWEELDTPLVPALVQVEGDVFPSCEVLTILDGHPLVVECRWSNRGKFQIYFETPTHGILTAAIRRFIELTTRRPLDEAPAL